MPKQPTQTPTQLLSLYIAIFLLAVSEAIIAYVQSSYLNQYFNLEIVSWIFILTYLITFWAINQYPNLIARFNNYKTAIISLIAKIAALLLFIFSANPFVIFFGFIIFTISFSLVFINFDIFLEAFSANAKTGRIRGTYFTIYNLGWLLSPLLSGLILQNLGYSFLFGIDIFLCLFVLIILMLSFSHLKNHYNRKHFLIKHTLATILKRINIKRIFYISFILHFFYAVMVLYMPIYLIQTIGLSWTEIGLIFTFMLLPFVLLQYPAGYLADKYIGEKEILTAGLIIMSIMSIAVFFVNSKSLIIWGLILFLTRIGASLVEIMRESYFFKKVDVENIDLINAMRSITPLSYIVAPLIISLILLVAPLNYVFLALGLIILLSLYPALTLKDTK